MTVFKALQDEYRIMAVWYDYFWGDYLNKTFVKPLSIALNAIQVAGEGDKTAVPFVVVDVGCGTGEFLKRLEERQDNDQESSSLTATSTPISYHGLEPSQEMLDQAKRKSGTVLWEQADAEDLPFADESVDLVVTTSAFHFFGDRCRALQEIFRILKYNNNKSKNVIGKTELYPSSLVITDWCADYWLVRLYHFRERVWWNYWKGYKELYPGPLRSSQLHQLVRDAGFSNVYVQTYQVRVFGIFYWGMQTATAIKMKRLP